MSSSDAQYLKEHAARATQRLREVLGRLPGRIADAADPSAWVKERPVTTLVGTFALSAWIAARLSSSKRVACEDASASGQARSRNSSLDMASAWIAPVLSMAAREIFSRIAELGPEPSREECEPPLTADLTPSSRPYPEFDPL